MELKRPRFVAFKINFSSSRIGIKRQEVICYVLEYLINKLGCKFSRICGQCEEDHILVE